MTPCVDRDIDNIIRDEGAPRPALTKGGHEKTANDVNDIFYFARAPVWQFVHRYLRHRRHFVAHLKQQDVAQSDLSLGLGHTLVLVHSKSLDNDQTQPWDADGELGYTDDAGNTLKDGSQFDFLQECLCELDATLAELETLVRNCDAHDPYRDLHTYS